MSESPPPSNDPNPTLPSARRQSTVGVGDIQGNTGGTVNIAGGDIIQYQLDVDRLAAALKQALPEDDPAPQQLLDVLNQFKTFHSHLYEWKEVHNLLNDIIYVLDQFAREVERMDAASTPGDPRALARLWRPVAAKMAVLLDWSSDVRFIAAPFVRQATGALTGPDWAVELEAARLRLEETLQPAGFNPAVLYDSTQDFSDVAERHMYLADKRLRDTAGELYTLSRIVLGSLNRG